MQTQANLKINTFVTDENGDQYTVDSLGNRLEKVDLAHTNEEDDVPRMRWCDTHLFDLAKGVFMGSINADVHKIKHQNFAIVSYLGPEICRKLSPADKPYKGKGIVKIRGVFRMREDAERFVADVVLKEDPLVQVHLVETFKWSALEKHNLDDELTKGDWDRYVDSVLRGYFENENMRLFGIQQRIEDTINGVSRPEETTKFFELANEGWSSQNAHKFVEEGKARLHKDLEEEILQECDGAGETQWKVCEVNEEAVQRALEIRDKLLENGEIAANDLQEETTEKDAEKESEEKGHVVVKLRPDAFAKDFPEQVFACVSIITPEEYKSEHYPNAEFTNPFIKIRGVFKTMEEAEAHVEANILPTDNRLDMVIIKCFEWTEVGETEHDDKTFVDEDGFLNDLLKGYATRQNNKMIGDPNHRRILEEKLTRHSPNRNPFA